MRETLYIFYFCLVTRHWAENTPNSIITLIIELAMRNIIAVQEFPNIPLCPVNNGRKKYLVFTSDTGNHSFFMVAPLVESPGKGRFPLSSGFKFISLRTFYTFLLTYTYQCNFSRARTFFIFSATPTNNLRW